VELYARVRRAVIVDKMSEREVARQFGLARETGWWKEFGGLQLEQAKKLKDLQKGNAQLKRALATLTLEKQVLKDIAEGNF
jgi:putative transposase